VRATALLSRNEVPQLPQLEPAVADSGRTNPAMAPPSSLAIDFGPTDEEINVRYWETY